MKLNHDIESSPLFDDFKDTLHFQIHRIQKAMFRSGNHLMQKAEIPLQLEQLPVLMVISAKKGISQQEIADMLHRDKSSVQRTIVGMEKKGLVKVTQDANDKRKNIVNATEGGYFLATKVKNIALQAEQEAFKAFSMDEKETAINSLKEIADKLEEKNK